MEDDFILDPFFGAGTVGLVAHELNRKYVGMELNPSYVKLAVERLTIAENNIIKVAI